MNLSVCMSARVCLCARLDIYAYICAFQFSIWGKVYLTMFRKAAFLSGDINTCDLRSSVGDPLE